MGQKNVSKTNRANGTTLARAIELMFRNVKSGNTIYISFSKKTFHFLIFTLAMAIIANIILAYIILKSPIFVGGIYTIIYTVLLILSIATIFSGTWLVFKGIDIITDDQDLK